MTKNDKIHNAMREVRREYPYHPVSMSACSNGCDRPSRGGGPCADCREKELAALIGEGNAARFVFMIEFEHNFTDRMIKRYGD